jgi:hypothetical protein
MNAVEIEEAVSRLAEQPFDPEGFAYAFLEAFGNKPTTIRRLKSGSTNQSDLGGVLQRGNIHLKVCGPGQVAETLKALRESPKTASGKAKFILASIKSKREAEGLAKSKLEQLCHRTRVDFTEDDGNIQVEDSQVMGFLEVLDRRRYEIDLKEQTDPEVYRAPSRSRISENS